jgi:hypothetical protein
MSYDVHVFIQNTSTAELADLLCDRLNTPTVRNGDEHATIHAKIFGVDLAIITDHGLENELGIPFSIYKHQVAFTLYAGRLDPSAGRDLCKALATVFARTIAAELRRKCLIVEGLQRVIEEVIP